MQVGLNTPQVGIKQLVQVLKNVEFQTVEVPPGTKVYNTDRKKLLPSPQWQTAIYLLTQPRRRSFCIN